MNVLNAILWTLVWFSLIGSDNWIRLATKTPVKEMPEDIAGVVGVIWLIGVTVCLFFTEGK